MKSFLDILPQNTVFFLKLHSFLYLVFLKRLSKTVILLCRQVQKRNEFHWLPLPPNSILSWTMRLCGNQATCNEEEESLQQRFPLCRSVATDNVCNVIPQPEILKEKGFEWRQTSNQIYPITASCVLRLEVWAVPSCTEP